MHEKGATEMKSELGLGKNKTKENGDDGSNSVLLLNYSWVPRIYYSEFQR